MMTSYRLPARPRSRASRLPIVMALLASEAKVASTVAPESGLPFRRIPIPVPRLVLSQVAVVIYWTPVETVVEPALLQLLATDLKNCIAFSVTKSALCASVLLRSQKRGLLLPPAPVIFTTTNEVPVGRAVATVAEIRLELPPSNVTAPLLPRTGLLPEVVWVTWRLLLDLSSQRATVPETDGSEPPLVASNRVRVSLPSSHNAKPLIAPTSRPELELLELEEADDGELLESEETELAEEAELTEEAEDGVEELLLELEEADDGELLEELESEEAELAEEIELAEEAEDGVEELLLELEELLLELEEREDGELLELEEADDGVEEELELEEADDGVEEELESEETELAEEAEDGELLEELESEETELAEEAELTEEADEELEVSGLLSTSKDLKTSVEQPKESATRTVSGYSPTGVASPE